MVVVRLRSCGAGAGRWKCGRDGARSAAVLQCCPCSRREDGTAVVDWTARCQEWLMYALRAFDSSGPCLVLAIAALHLAFPTNVARRSPES